MELTRDAEKLVAVAYKEYLKRIDDGVPRVQAKCFEPQEIQPIYFEKYSMENYKDIVASMTRAFDCTMYLSGGFLLNDSAIVYMESRFKNGVKDVLSFLAQFVP